MATIEKRLSNGNISYRVKVRLKGFPDEFATFERITDAKEWAQAVETRMREGRYFNTQLSKKYTLGDAVERYIKSILPRKPKCIKDQKRHLERWSEEIGSYSLSNINSALIAQVRDKLLQKQSHEKKARTQATVNRYMATLSHLYTIAIKEWGWVHENCVAKLPKLKEPRGRTRFLSDTERNALYKGKIATL